MADRYYCTDCDEWIDDDEVIWCTLDAYATDRDECDAFCPYCERDTVIGVQEMDELPERRDAN